MEFEKYLEKWKNIRNEKVEDGRWNWKLDGNPCLLSSRT